MPRRFSLRRLSLVVLLIAGCAVAGTALAAVPGHGDGQQQLRDLLKREGAVAQILRGPGRDSSDEALLRVDQRSVFAGAQVASARSLEFWARPQPVRRHGQVRRGRLSLGWGSTRVRFRTALPVRQATHVVVQWSDDAIGLFFDANQVEAASLGAPSETAQAHRVVL